LQKRLEKYYRVAIQPLQSQIEGILITDVELFS